jgi:hypothetical protein
MVGAVSQFPDIGCLVEAMMVPTLNLVPRPAFFGTLISMQ